MFDIRKTTVCTIACASLLAFTLSTSVQAKTSDFDDSGSKYEKTDHDKGGKDDKKGPSDIFFGKKDDKEKGKKDDDWAKDDCDSKGMKSFSFKDKCGGDKDHGYKPDPKDCDPAPVPLPAAGFLLMGGLGGLAALRRRKTV